MTQMIHIEGWIGVSQIQGGGDSGEVKILGGGSSVKSHRIWTSVDFFLLLLLSLQCTYTSFPVKSNFMFVTVLVILFSK